MTTDTPQPPRKSITGQPLEPTGVTDANGSEIFHEYGNILQDQKEWSNREKETMGLVLKEELEELKRIIKALKRTK